VAFKKGQGGRRKGTVNKATADLKALARPYTAEALATILVVMRDEKGLPQARLGAANAILDRGHGKAPQAVTGADGGAIATVTRVIHEHIP